MPLVSPPPTARLCLPAWVMLLLWALPACSQGEAAKDAPILLAAPDAGRAPRDAQGPGDGEAPRDADDDASHSARDASPAPGTDAGPPPDAGPPDAPPDCTWEPLVLPPAPGLFWDGDLERLRQRLSQPPFDQTLERLRQEALRTPPAPNTPGAMYVRGNIAKAAAFVGLLEPESGAMAHARQIIEALPAETAEWSDLTLDIHLSDGLAGHAVALHLLESMNEDSPLARQALGRHAAHLLERFAYRTRYWAAAYNNHATKGAAAVGLAALVLPEHPAAETWLRWSVAWLQHLWVAQGLFDADGAYAEGPYYNMYQMITAGPLLVALDRALAGRPGLCGLRICHLRPLDRTCTDGGEWVENLIDLPRVQASFDAVVTLTRPDGTLEPYNDSLPAGYPAALLAPAAHHGGLAWLARTWPMLSWTASVEVESVLGWDERLASAPPAAGEVFLERSGILTRRSGWGTQDSFAMLLAEDEALQGHGHDQADALSFTLFSHGRPRLIDPGYSRWGEHMYLNTFDQHNTVAIDGVGPRLPSSRRNTQPVSLRREGGQWIATMTLGGGEVTRRVRFEPDGLVVVEDEARFASPGNHTMTVYWHGIGALEGDPDSRGARFEPMTEGGRWHWDGHTTEVLVQGASLVESALKYDGLVYGQLLRHRALVVHAEGEGTVRLVSRIRVMPEGGR